MKKDEAIIRARCSLELKARVLAIAKALGMNESAVVRQAMEWYLSELDPAKDKQRDVQRRYAEQFRAKLKTNYPNHSNTGSALNESA